MNQVATSPTFRRAALPEVLLAEDVALVRDCSLATARRAMRSGDCGPVGRFGRRLYVLRSTFLLAIAERASKVPLTAAAGQARLRLVEGEEARNVH